MLGLLLLVFRAGTVSAAEPPLGLPLEYSVRRWSGVEGLQARTVETVHQSRDGYLWLGMNDGLCRFDGVSFRRYGPDNTSQIEVGYVSAIAEDPDGDLWIGSAGGGLLRMRQGQFSRIGVDQGLTNAQVKVLCFAADGRLWVGTDGGGAFVREASGRFRHYGKDDGLDEPFVVGLTEGEGGQVFVVTYREGPRVLKGDRFVPVALDPPLKSGLGYSLTRSASGRVWLGTPRGVYRYADGRFRRWEEAAAVPGHDFVVAWEQPAGDVWLGSAQGLVHWRDGVFTPYPVGGGSSGRLASAFLQDREGSVWSSTEGAGLVQLRRTKFVTLGSAEGLAGDEVTSVLEGRNGALWVGTTKGLSRFADGRLQNFTKASGMPDDFVLSVHEDPSGVLWVATRLGGLLRYQDGRFSTLPPSERPSGRASWCLYGARDGSVWAGTPAGALQYRDGRIVSRVTREQGLSNEDVRCFAETPDGALWIGTSYGVNCWRGGQMTNFAVVPGLPPIEVVVSLHTDRSGDLWIGTMTRGLYRHRDGRFSHAGARHGLPGNTIVSIVQDQSDRLWLGTGRGIVRFDRRDFEPLATDTNALLKVETFGRSAGLRTEECAGTVQPTVALGRDGRLWVGTSDGLTTTLPERMPRNDLPPVTRVERVALEGAEPVPFLSGLVAGSPRRSEVAREEASEAPAPAASRRSVFRADGFDALRIPPGQDRVEFQYAGLSFVAPESLRFQYRLDGFDPGWVDAGTRRAAYYTRIPPGSYRFQVRATHVDGVAGEAGAVLGLVVEPAWSQRLSLRIVVAVAGLGLVGYTALRRVRRLERERLASEEYSRQLLRSQEVERARLAGELHDGLAQELQIIRNRAELALERRQPDANLARELLAISATAGHAIRSARAMARGLRPPELDHLGLTQALRWLGEHTASGYSGRLEARIDTIDGLLERQLEVDLYRIAQEALNNAVKHAAATEITLEVDRTPDGFSLCVFDNGRGFVTDEVPAGSGLRGMRERAAMLRGTLELRSELGVGTRFTLHVPVTSTSSPPP